MIEASTVCTGWESKVWATTRCGGWRGVGLLSGLLLSWGWIAGGAVAWAQEVPSPETATESSSELSAELPAEDVAEPGSAEDIAAWTTDPRYLPASVASVPESVTVPSPADALGQHAGAPGILSDVATVHGYFRTLGEASERVYVETLGGSEEGRDMLLAVISSAENLTDLDRLVTINHALTDPRRTPRQEAEELALGGKVFYYLIGGLHSTETGSPEMLMELAYRLAVSERPEIRRLRDEAVILITPVAEPDGRDRVVQWYERHLKGRDLPWDELRTFASPPYWGHYAFHDNNRDGMQRALALTRSIHEVFYRFRPQVMHDLHESLPLLYISTGHGPYSPAVDPVTVHEWTLFAHREAAAMGAQGLPGVWTFAFWDGWWPGYLISVAHNHNAVGRFYETFGNVSAETFERDLSEVRYLGEKVTDTEWYRPWPPEETVEWSLRNNTNYMQAGVLEALGTAVNHRRELLLNHWVKAERAVARGRDEAPHGWIFPPAQRDPTRRDHLVNLLREHGVEVHRLEGELTLGEETYPTGSHVVRFDQPHGRAAKNFLERQEFPADEPNPPYDDVAWTWPLLFGVDGEAVADAALLEVPVWDPAAVPVEPEPAEEPRRRRGRRTAEPAEPPPPPLPRLEPVTAPVARAGRISGFGDDIFLLADHGQTSLLAARVMLGRHQVDAVESPFSAAGKEFPAGSWLVFAPRAEVERVANRLGLDFEAVLTLPAVGRRHIVDLPRLGLVHTWTSTQDAGWARYSLDQAGMPYDLVSPDDLRRASRGDGFTGRGLAGRYDVLLVPSLRGDLKRLVHGIDPRYGPLAYTATPEYPSHGTPNASPDVTGGMGFEGLLALERFVADGGVIVALANGGTLVVESGLVRGVERASERPRTPGSELQARVRRPGHPLAYGYDRFPSVFRGNGPLWEVPDRLEDRVVVQFGAPLPEGVEEAPVVTSEPSDATVAVPGAGELGEAGDGELLIEELPVEEPATEEPTGEPTEDEGEENGLEAGLEIPQDEPATGPVESDDAGESAEAPAPEDLPLVLSGFVDGEAAVSGQPAILDLPTGRGRVVLFAFNPLHRYLNLSDFRFAWNALLHWNDLPP